MKNKKVIVFYILLLVLVPIIAIFIYNKFIVYHLVFITNPDGTRKVEWIKNVKECPYHYTNVYAEGENVDYKYKVIFTLNNNRVINCRYILEFFDIDKANKSLENKKTNEYITDLKLDNNIMSFNDNLAYDITLEHLLETLKSAKEVIVF